MMNWTDMPMAAFDTETTGPVPTECRLVTAYIGRIDGSVISAKEWIVDPGIEIPEGAAAVHGVTTEVARDTGMNYEEGYRQIREELEDCWATGRIVVAYNASFDLTLINEEGLRLGYSTLECGPTVDPYVLDRHLFKYRKGKRTLGVTAKHYGMDLENAHTADADALAGARIAWKLGRDPKAADIHELDAQTLMERQAEWHMERQMDFRDYLIKKADDEEARGKELLESAAEARASAETVNGDWPIRKAG